MTAERTEDAVARLAGRRVMVVGLGRSGRAVARFLDGRGARLVLTDLRVDVGGADLPAAELRLGAEDERWLEGVELVVTSPGVAPTSALLRAAVARRVPVLSELELAARFVAAPLVAVTGTNGKSTVATLLGEIFKAAGMETFVGGNLGTPLIEAAGRSFEVAVVEVSSFQLEWIERFRPHVGVHLNLSDDHFDRYRDLDEYGRAKARLFENQEANDWAVLNRDDPSVWKLRDEVSSRVLSFGLSPAARGVWPEAGSLQFDDGRRRMAIGLGGFQLPGRHNLVNAMAAAGAALLAGAGPAVVERALANFKGLPHRMEFVREKDGVAFVDDSKGTNVGAVVEALAATPAPIILIAGGMDKGGDYAPLRAPLGEKVRRLILIGAARAKMAAALSGAAEIEVEADLAGAVRRAAATARRGETVLLSPACSSFDQFRDYAERGRVFKELVRAL